MDLSLSLRGCWGGVLFFLEGVAFFNSVISGGSPLILQSAEEAAPRVVFQPTLGLHQRGPHRQQYQHHLELVKNAVSPLPLAPY